MQAEQTDGVQVPQTDILIGLSCAWQMHYNEFTRGDPMAITKRYSNKKGTRSVHYDTSGNKVLSSYRSSSGQIKHYAKNGRYLGSTREGGYGHVYHYDDHGNKVGVTYIKPSGSVRHYPIAQKTGFG